MLRTVQMERHSLIGHTAYADLLRIAKTAPLDDLRGTIERKQVRGKAFVYDRYRIGEAVKSRYIGELTPQLEADLARRAETAVSAKERQKQQSRLVRILRAEGYSPLDAKTGSLISAMARIGVFRLGGTLVGTMAFRQYEAELGVVLGSDRLAQTGDIDIVSFERLSLAICDTVTEPVDNALSELNFTALPSMDRGKVWRWEDSAAQVQVEFLTPAFGDEGLKDLPALGVTAQGLHYLNFLIAEPIKAVVLYRSGILVQIPRPEAFAIHKLIEADRRRAGPDALKSRKDRAQAALLIEVLAEDRPDELAEAYAEALGRGVRWRTRIKNSLARMPGSAAILASLPEG